MTKKSQDASSLARLFRALGDPTRLSIIQLLMRDEFNVTLLCRELGIAQPSVSHHLGILRAHGLVQARRRGKEVHYSLRDFMADHTGRALRGLLEDCGAVRIGPVVMGMVQQA